VRPASLAVGCRDPVQSNLVPPAPPLTTRTTWLPRSCSPSDMSAATMQYDRASRGSGQR